MSPEDCAAPHIPPVTIFFQGGPRIFKKKGSDFQKFFENFGRQLLSPTLSPRHYKKPVKILKKTGKKSVFKRSLENAEQKNRIFRRALPPQN